MSELEITRKILHALNQVPECFAWENLSTASIRNGKMVARHGFQIKGTSDILGVFGGRFFALEVKTPERRGNTSLHQKAFISKVRRCGGVAEVITSVEEALDAMSKLAKL